jgi:8-oxo-dGTP pyrophosphatase MutT (NUDIX family)
MAHVLLLKAEVGNSSVRFKLLVHRRGEKSKAPGTLSVPGGSFNLDERKQLSESGNKLSVVRKTALREFGEEAGGKPKNGNLDPITVNGTSVYLPPGILEQGDLLKNGKDNTWYMVHVLTDVDGQYAVDWDPVPQEEWAHEIDTEFGYKWVDFKDAVDQGCPWLSHFLKHNLVKVKRLAVKQWSSHHVGKAAANLEKEVGDPVFLVEK